MILLNTRKRKTTDYIHELRTESTQNTLNRWRVAHSVTQHTTVLRNNIDQSSRWRLAPILLRGSVTRRHQHKHTHAHLCTFSRRGCDCAAALRLVNHIGRHGWNVTAVLFEGNMGSFHKLLGVHAKCSRALVTFFQFQSNANIRPGRQ